jgi:hypothetical protein
MAHTALASLSGRGNRELLPEYLSRSLYHVGELCRPIQAYFSPSFKAAETERLKNTDVSAKIVLSS